MKPCSETPVSPEFRDLALYCKVQKFLVFSSCPTIPLNFLSLFRASIHPHKIAFNLDLLALSLADWGDISSLSFLASAALQKGAVLNYVNDSAPMHFATAVNAPVAAIYCSTVPDFGYGPLSDTSFIIETKQALSCRPCGLHGKKQCPQKHFNCAETISLEQIYQPLQQVLHN